MIRLIATDLDGTLIPAGKKIPEPVLRALQKAIDSGIEVVPASGRSLAAIPPEILRLSGLHYAISSNGAMVQDLKKNQVLRRVLLPAPEAADLLRFLHREQVYSCVYSENQIYNWQKLPEDLEQYYPSRMTIFHQNPQEDLAAFLEQRGLGIEKIFVAVWDEEKRKKIRRELERWPDAQVTSSSLWNLEVNRKGADKGSALAWLSNMLHIPREEVAALGDNENDRTMLAFAGRPASPENGMPEAKELARELFPPCEDAGAAEWIQKILLDR